MEVGRGEEGESRMEEVADEQETWEKMESTEERMLEMEAVERWPRVEEVAWRKVGFVAKAANCM